MKKQTDKQSTAAKHAKWLLSFENDNSPLSSRTTFYLSIISAIVWTVIVIKSGHYNLLAFSVIFLAGGYNSFVRAGFNDLVNDLENKKLEPEDGIDE